VSTKRIQCTTIGSAEFISTEWLPVAKFELNNEFQILIYSLLI
jgi:hypothetical protein